MDKTNGSDHTAALSFSLSPSVYCAHIMTTAQALWASADTAAATMLPLWQLLPLTTTRKSIN